MAACTAVTYLCGLLIDGRAEKKARRRILIAGIVCNVGMLAYFKYTGMLLDLITRVCDALSLPFTMPKVSILLPVGISF